MGRLFGKKEKSIMSFINFSGVFGVYEGTKLIESGAYGFANKNFRIQNSTDLCYGTASGTKGFTAVVEAVAGMSFPSFARQHVFTKLVQKFTDDQEYLEKELKNALPRVQCLELEIEHMTGKLVNES